MKAAFRRIGAYLLDRRSLVHVVSFAVTGEWKPRRHRMLAETIHQGGYEFLLDLGCGEASVLDFVRTARYVGVDQHSSSLDRAMRSHESSGCDFVATDLATCDLGQWREADCVVLSSLSHHLSNRELTELVQRIWDEIAPRTMLIQEAEPIGPLGPVVRMLDAGMYMRTEQGLTSLLSDNGCSSTRLWEYTNPLRSFRQFLLNVTATHAGAQSVAPAG